MEVTLSKQDQQRGHHGSGEDECGIREHQGSAHGTPRNGLQPEDRISTTSYIPLARTQIERRSTPTGGGPAEASLKRYT
jgi:hypothetical protein